MSKTKIKKAKSEATVPAAPEVVTQDIVASFYEKNTRYQTLKEQAAALAKELEAQEAALIAKIKGGAIVAPGSFVAGVNTAPGRCNPKWKDEATLLAASQGKAASIYEAEVKAKYPPKMVDSLVISKLG